MGRKIILTIVCFFMVFLMAVSVYFYVYCKENEKRAKEIAVKHLETTYSEQMDYIGIETVWMDTSMYRVFFKVRENPDIDFEVRIDANHMSLLFQKQNHQERYPGGTGDVT